MVKTWKPNKESSKILLAAQRVLNEYQYPITFKQLYYRLVTEEAIDNSLASYRKLNSLITNARKNGRLAPSLFIPNFVEDNQDEEDTTRLENYLDRVVNEYHIDRMTNQKNYVEVWVGNEEMYGFMSTLLAKFDVPVYVFQGYSSYQFTYQAYRRMSAAVQRGQVPRILYFSDLSVSSMNIFESVLNEMASMFEMSYTEISSIIFSVGVLPDHVVKYDLVTAPDAPSDSRVKLFDEKYGDILESIGLPRNIKVELESVDPKWLRALLYNAVFSILDYNVMREVEKKEQEDREKLRAILSRKSRS